ncbi:MAG: hypothetical protein KGI37_08885 [Alphaproteobacteria bacterium]|nr:hypothetical protein [Alphaproteobacteria bacterium]
MSMLLRLRAYDFAFPIAVLIWAGIAMALCTYGRMFILDTDYPRALAEYHLIVDQCVTEPRIITGDSVTRDGIDPRILGPNILNVSLGASNPIELYFELKDMRWCTPGPREVYIAITPHHFVYDDGYWGSAVRYGLLTQDEIQQVRDDSARLSDNLLYHQGRLGFNNAVTVWLKDHHAPTVYLPSIRNSLLSPRYEKNIALYNTMISNHGYDAKTPLGIEPAFPNKPVPTKVSLEGADKTFKPNPLATLYFNKILALLRKQNIHVVFFNMPISDLTKSVMTPEYAQAYQAYIERILAKYDNVSFVGGWFPTMPIRYFNDETHLNARGAYEWTEKIKDTLNSAAHTDASRHQP